MEFEFLDIHLNLEDNLNQIANWHKNKHVSDFCAVSELASFDNMYTWYKKDYLESKDKQFYMVCSNSTPIGYTSLENIGDRSAEFGFVIGDPKKLNLGIGTSAMYQFLYFQFEIAKKLDYVTATVYGENQRCLRVITKLGFDFIHVVPETKKTPTSVFVCLTKEKLRKPLF